MFLDDTPAYPAAFFGAVRAGFVPLLINTLTPPDLLQFYLSDAGADGGGHRRRVRAAINAEACKDTPLQTLIVVNGTAGEHAVPNSFTGAQWLQGSATDLPEADTGRDEMAFWMYSSGSTGRPKGIVHLQHDMAYSEQAFARSVLKLGPDDICFSVPKIFFRLRLRQRHHVSVLGRCGDGAVARAAQTRGDVRGDRADIARRYSSGCRRSIPR